MTLSKTFLAVLATGLMVVSQQAQAILITGNISLAGGSVVTNTGNLATATAITSFGSAVTTVGDGSYAGVTFGTPVTTTGFTFLPTLSPSPVDNLWSFNFGGSTYSFDLTGIQAVSQGVDVNGLQFLQISGTGFLQITGFEDTKASYLLTANQSGATFSFSSSNGAVPDGGATVALLGLTLAGIEGLRRKLPIA